MARKIGVIEAQGTIPSTYIKKCVALLQVRRNVARWEEPGVSIKMRSEFDPAFLPVPSRSYIPTTMPVAEDGTRFQLPTSPSWLEQHGMASSSLKIRAYMTMKAWRTA